jgi:hypothetical protein
MVFGGVARGENKSCVAVADKCSTLLPYQGQNGKSDDKSNDEEDKWIPLNKVNKSQPISDIRIYYPSAFPPFDDGYTVFTDKPQQSKKSVFEVILGISLPENRIISGDLMYEITGLKKAGNGFYELNVGDSTKSGVHVVYLYCSEHHAKPKNIFVKIAKDVQALDPKITSPTIIQETDSDNPSGATAKKAGKYNGHGYVDLGLSVLWAACNVGASAPEEYGGYYAWGETEEKSDYSVKSYKFHNPSQKEYEEIGDSICGTSYDVAHVKWGGSWRLPTIEEIREFTDKCKYKWTTYKGVSGGLFTGPNGNSIFLPAAGFLDGKQKVLQGGQGEYWSGSIYYDDQNANYLFFFRGRADWFNECRLNGISVRPVAEK